MPAAPAGASVPNRSRHIRSHGLLPEVEGEWLSGSPAFRPCFHRDISAPVCSSPTTIPCCLNCEGWGHPQYPHLLYQQKMEQLDRVTERIARNSTLYFERKGDKLAHLAKMMERHNPLSL